MALQDLGQVLCVHWDCRDPAGDSPGHTEQSSRAATARAGSQLLQFLLPWKNSWNLCSHGKTLGIRVPMLKVHISTQCGILSALGLYPPGLSVGVTRVCREGDVCSHEVGEHYGLENIFKSLPLKMFINAGWNETVGDGSVFRTWDFFQGSCFCCSEVPFLVQVMLSRQWLLTPLGAAETQILTSESPRCQFRQLFRNSHFCTNTPLISQAWFGVGGCSQLWAVGREQNHSACSQKCLAQSHPDAFAQSQLLFNPCSPSELSLPSALADLWWIPGCRCQGWAAANIYPRRVAGSRFLDSPTSVSNDVYRSWAWVITTIVCRKIERCCTDGSALWPWLHGC